MELEFKDGWFGMVTSDAFLTRFEHSNRLRVVREWLRVLAPEGAAITTVRLDSSAAKVKAGERDVAQFVERAHRAALQQAHLLTCTVDDIENMARNYATKIVSYPVTEKQLNALFTDFDTQLTVADTHGEFKPTVYARVLATKRFNMATSLQVRADAFQP